MKAGQRAAGSGVISEARYLGQEVEMGRLEGESLGLEWLGVPLKCLDKASWRYPVCFMLHSFPFRGNCEKIKTKLSLLLNG